MNDTKNRSMLMNRKTEVVDDEVNELLPQDAQSPQDVDDLLGSIGTRGLDVVEGGGFAVTPRWNRSTRTTTRKSSLT